MPPDALYTFSLAPSSGNPLVTEQRLDHGSLKALLLTSHPGEKDGTAFIPAIFNHCPPICRNRGVGQNCGGNKRHRLAANVNAITAIALDLDKITKAEFEAHLERLRRLELETFWYETFGSGPEQFKARIIIFFNEPYKLAKPTDWAPVWASLVHYLGFSGAVDKSCNNPDRLYYLPRHVTGGTLRRMTGYLPGKLLSWQLATYVAEPPITTTPPPQRNDDLDSRVLAYATAVVDNPQKRKALLNVLAGHMPAQLPNGRDPGGQPRNHVWLEVTHAYATCGPACTDEELLVKLRPAWLDEQRQAGDDVTPWEEVERLLLSARPKIAAKVPVPEADTFIMHRGKPVPSLANVVRVLETEGSDLHYEEFSRQLVHGGKIWSEAESFALADHMQADLGFTTIPLHIVQHGIRAYAYKHRRNAMQIFLNGLKWDGLPRTEGFFHAALGAENTEYTRVISSNFWRCLVARPLSPGCKVDNMVVLEGPQGLYKSSACRAIAGGGEYFAEISQPPTSKDFYMAMDGKLLVEIGEMHAFNRAEVSAIKTALSRDVDSYRRPYGLDSGNYPRQSIFIGTTNQDDWARDPTGQRRFWPIRCTKIDLSYIREYRNQLLAEAVAQHRNQVPWWHVPPAAAEEQEARFQVDPWEEILTPYLETLPAGAIVRSGELLVHVLHITVDKLTVPLYMRVTTILKRLGWYRPTGRAGRDRQWLRSPAR
jgi:Virulence-associated protein E